MHNNLFVAGSSMLVYRGGVGGAGGGAAPPASGVLYAIRYTQINCSATVLRGTRYEGTKWSVHSLE